MSASQDRDSASATPGSSAPQAVPPQAVPPQAAPTHGHEAPGHAAGFAPAACEPVSTSADGPNGAPASPGGVSPSRSEGGPNRKGLSDLQVHAAGLAGLPGMTPVRLAKLLDGFEPILAWAAVRAGTHPADPERKVPGAGAGHRSVRRRDAHIIGTESAFCCPTCSSIRRCWWGMQVRRPYCSLSGIRRFSNTGQRVAIVGTRSATHYGRQVASELARDLAAEGVDRGFGTGAGHRRSGARRSAPGKLPRPRSTGGGCRHWARCGLSLLKSGALGGRRGSGGDPFRIGTRDETPSGCVPRPQSDHRRPLRRGGGG